MLNVVVLSGVLSSAPVLRSFDSGARLVTMSVRVPSDRSRATSVPVVMWDPPATLAELAPDSPVLAVGHVRRRFSTGGDGTPRVRVEVVADTVVPGRAPARRARAIDRAVRVLTDESNDER